MSITVKISTTKGSTIHQGDPWDVQQIVKTAIARAVTAGESAAVTIEAVEESHCEYCKRITPDTEPRRNQETRYTKGYLSCSVCGHVKGIV
jgi:protein-disulfide isomerase